jgi:hypothetical protein
MANTPVAPISLVATGVMGLNLQASATLLTPQWATRADNLVFNNQGILTSRSGWTVANSTPMTGSPTVQQIFEYTPISGSNQVISTGGNKLWSGTTTLTNITGALTPSADNWKFVNFNGNVYGLQASHPLISWNGTGNFAAVTAASGSAPNGNELLGAFGRLWGSDSTGQVLKYSQLLDATNWNVAGAGSINLTSVWGTGNDSIVALASFNNLLIVFGSRNIIIWGDNSGSVLGLDPSAITVTDLIPGIGCMARDSVQNVNGEDLVFLSYSGVQSLRRLIIERSNATRNISMNVRDQLLQSAVSENPNNIKSTCNPVQGLYLLIFPTSQNIFAFDTRQVLQDQTWRVTQFTNFYPTALYTLHDNATTYGGYAGQLFQYSGNQDNGTSYTASYTSGWFDLGEQLNTRLKILKRLGTILNSTGSGTLNLRWQFDFSGSWFNYQIPIMVSTSGGFGSSQFGYDMFGPAAYGASVEAPGQGKGQYVQIGVDWPVNGAGFTLQHMELYAKVGRVI